MTAPVIQIITRCFGVALRFGRISNSGYLALRLVISLSLKLFGWEEVSSSLAMSATPPVVLAAGSVKMITFD